MTVTEFSNELDIIYENINKNGAPGLDEYEKSVILTTAQELLVKKTLTQDSGAHSFPELVTVKESISPSTNGYDEGYVFSGVTNSLKILNEYILDGSDRYEVVVISNEIYSLKKGKPYQYPPRRKAWRLGLKTFTGVTPSVEVFPRDGVTPNKYVVRYVRKPEPIILENLAGLTPSVSIDGETALHECELNTGWHRDILNLAANLAEQYYIEKHGSADN